MRGLFALLFLCDCFFPVRPFLLVLFCRPSVRTWSPFPPAFSWLSNPLGACYRSSKGRTIPSSFRPLQPTTTVACTATLWPEPRAEPRRDLPTDAPLRPHHLLHPQPPANSTASLLPTSNPPRHHPSAPVPFLPPPPLSSSALPPPTAPLPPRPPLPTMAPRRLLPPPPPTWKEPCDLLQPPPHVCQCLTSNFPPETSDTKVQRWITSQKMSQDSKQALKCWSNDCAKWATTLDSDTRAQLERASVLWGVPVRTLSKLGSSALGRILAATSHFYQ